MKVVDAFIAFVLIGFVVVGVTDGKIPTNINPFQKKFSTFDECFSFVKKNPLSMEKLNIGATSCQVIYGPNKAAAQTVALNFFQCILNNYDEILDDSSGTRVVAKCGNSSHESSFSFYFAQQFNPAMRIAKVLEEERKKREWENSQLNLFSEINNLNNHRDGTLIPCMKIGLEIDCP
jgi:hypothetical protein